ncbi:MAG: CDP-alcohol phosphatidyltransferase family protein [Chloroflexi bacterium]|nr:CDP-alcohol phosphatidyltransferase family protein [Chloroflexota bacterium]
MTPESPTPPKITRTDRLRARTDRWLLRAGRLLHARGVHPDTVTLLGLALVALAALVIAGGALQLGGLILLIGLPLDALDGAVARAMQRADRFGGVLDSTLDRVADGLILGALAYYFATVDQFGLLLLALTGLVGSYVVSYVRARAGEADLAVRVGLLTRLERVLLLLAGLIVPPLIVPALVILAVGSVITGVQRLWFVYQHLDRED